MESTEQFNSIYSAYFSSVFAYFCACFGKDQAESLAQQTFLQVWRALKNRTFEEPKSWKAWVFRTAVNVKNDWLRKKRVSPVTVAFDDRLDLPAPQGCEEHLQAIAVRTAFSCLLPQERELLLWGLAGFTSDEIADMLGGVSASTIRGRIAAARKRFRAHLHENGVVCDE